MKETNNSNKSFFEKIKTDKKYKAKVQLTGYVVLIILIIIYLNITNLGKNYNYNTVIDTNTKKIEDQQEDTNLLDELKDNYTYSIDLSLKKITSDQNNTTQNIEPIETKYHYDGKAYKNNLIINKTSNNTTLTYYKVDNEYYQKENDNYNLVKKELIYDLLEEKYIEVEGIKKYIETSNLDHYTNYSSGKKEYIYNLKVSDIIKNYKEDDIVPINITIENETITMNIDYTNLLKLTDENITECILSYTYKDINKVEEFTIIAREIEDQNNSISEIE